MQVILSLLIVVAFAGRAGADLPTCHATKHASDNHEVDVATGRIRFCFTSPSACFVYDKTWTPAPVPTTRETPKPPATAKIDLGTTAKVCATDGTDCHSFTASYTPTDDYRANAHAYASPDRSTVILVRSNDVIVLDGKTGAQRAAIPAWEQPSNPSVEIYFIGDRFAVWRTNGGDGVARLFDTASGALVGDLGTVGGPPIFLRDGAFAYITAHRKALEVRDRAAKLVHSIPVDAKHYIDGFGLVGNAILVAHDATIMLVDTTTFATTMLAPPPNCP